jgi:hypothetical protein
MLARSLADYKSMASRLANEVEALGQKLQQADRSHAEVASHLNDQVIALTEERAALKLTIEEFKALADERERKLTAAADTRFARLQFDGDEKFAKLNAENASMKQQLYDLRFFREEKENIERQIRELKDKLSSQTAETTAAAEETERSFLLEFERQRKAAEGRIEELKKAARVEALKLLDAEGAGLRVEVVKLREELKSTQEYNDMLRKENDRFRSEQHKSRLNIELSEQRDEEYAKRGVQQQRTIKELQSKNQSLERTMTQVLSDFEAEKKKWAEFHANSTQDTKNELASLRQLVKLKTRELDQIKKLSKVILSQRSEVEQFMLEALDQVKLEIAQKREQAFKTAKLEYSRQVREAAKLTQKTRTKFPSLSSKRLEGSLAPMPTIAPPEPVNGRVELKDLSAEDRERVLRLLFARMNGAQASSRANDNGIYFFLSNFGREKTQFWVFCFSLAGWSSRGDSAGSMSAAVDAFAPALTPLPPLDDNQDYQQEYNEFDDDPSSFMITQQQYDEPPRSRLAASAASSLPQGMYLLYSLFVYIY